MTATLHIEVVDPLGQILSCGACGKTFKWTGSACVFCGLAFTEAEIHFPDGSMMRAVAKTRAEPCEARLR